MLLFAKYKERSYKPYRTEPYLHLSIHEIRSDHRVGPALWSFNGTVDRHFDYCDWVPIKSTKNALGITFGVQFIDHWKLFNISTTDTDALNNFPLIELGRVDSDLKICGTSLGLSKIVMQSC